MTAKPPTAERAGVEVEKFLAILAGVKDKYKWRTHTGLHTGQELIRTEGDVYPDRPDLGLCPICAVAHAAGLRYANGAPNLVGFYHWYDWLRETHGISDRTAQAVAFAADGREDDDIFPLKYSDIRARMIEVLGL